MFTNAYIPYNMYYTSPFSRYNKTFKNYNSIELSSKTSKQWFASKDVDTKLIDYVLYGTSVHQHRGFWAGPWSAALMGCEHTTGHMINQACTTGLLALYNAATNIENNLCNTTYCLTADRTSNGPIVNWPEYDVTENWIEDNFAYDPWGKTSMLVTAELVAKKISSSKELFDEVTVRRHEQYSSIKNKSYMYETLGLKDDEGIKKITLDRLKRLKSISKNGYHSIGNVTYPADGHCGILVSNKEYADRCSDLKVQILSYGYSRCEKSLMPLASIDATKMALKNANISIDQIKVINQHNAFVVNDVAFAEAFGIDVFNMNNYGSPLVYGHPQSPVLSRLTIEAIEELVEKGGGYGLITGAAGGDTGAAMIIKVY
jgi:acetyl-CoA acetyltransferase